MGVALNFNWRYLSTPGDTNTDTVGWLAAPDSNASPYQRMSAMLAGLRQVGFSAFLLPPSTKGAAGSFSGGYDLFDPYDIGSKNQCGAIPTAFGTAEELRQLVGIAHRYECQVYIDLVLHQYDGGTADGVYTYPGSTEPGRWPKHTTCFTGIPGGVAADDVPNEEGNFGFGQMPSYQNAAPPGYMWDGAIVNAQWLVATLGTDGMRIDDSKGTNADIVYDILTSAPLANQYAFFEYYDGDTGAISTYVNGYEKRRGAALDFTTKFNVGTICNNNSSVWMGQLANIGWCTIDASTCVTWVESADTDTSPGEQIIWNKMLAYAVIMTFPGYPMVYARDYLTGDECYGLGPLIDNLVWIHEYLAQGAFVVRLDSDFQVFAHERTGYGDSPGCVCFFSNDQYAEHTVTVQTRYWPNTRLHEYTGNGGYSDDHWTDENGDLTVTLPRNVNGMSYLVFALPGVSGGFGSTPQETNQTFFGAVDLDIGPMVSGTLAVGRVWAAAGTYFSCTLTADSAAWGNSVDIAVHVVDASGFLAMMPYDDQGSATQGHTITAKLSGWHAVSLMATACPPLAHRSSSASPTPPHPIWRLPHDRERSPDCHPRPGEGRRLRPDRLQRDLHAPLGGRHGVP